MGPNQTFRLVIIYRRHMYLTFVIKFSLSWGIFFFQDTCLEREKEDKWRICPWCTATPCHVSPLCLVQKTPVAAGEQQKAELLRQQLQQSQAKCPERVRTLVQSTDVLAVFWDLCVVAHGCRPIAHLFLTQSVMLLYLVGCWYWQGELSNGINCDFSIILSLRNDFTNTLTSDCLCGLASAVFMLWRLQRQLFNSEISLNKPVY